MAFDYIINDDHYTRMDFYYVYTFQIHLVCFVFLQHNSSQV